MFWRKKVEPPQPPEPEMDDEVLSQVVLAELHRHLIGYNSCSFIGGGPRESALNKEQREINRLLGWSRSVSNRQIRLQYMRWLDHFQRGLDEAFRELKTQEQKKEMQEYSKKNDELFDRVRELRATGVVPAPPKE